MFGKLPILCVLGRDGVYLPEAGKTRYLLSNLPCHSGKSMWPRLGQSDASAQTLNWELLAQKTGMVKKSSL